MSSADPHDGAGVAAETLARIVAPAFERLDGLASAVQRSCPPGATGWSEAQMRDVRTQIEERIGDDPVQVGMGFLAAPGLVDGQDRYMLWWQQHEGRTSRLLLNFDRSSIDVYDYVEMEWFQYGADGPDRVAYGPYFDYSGSERYVITATVPVEIEGRFVGVVGVDLLFEELERRLVAALRRAEFEAVVVNAERRVIVANTARWIPGARLRSAPQVGDPVDGAAISAVAEIPLGIGWTVATTDQELRKEFGRRS
ncbi:hypothetical protein CLV56_0788 [Mumia flava]|uniref:Cache domain-containing protein n=1 Tax=Mumia flava TaxID=1348852 RepID=A0A2M9BF57_9ACTN|nr:hypothetical protein [Mumia flava]PJJ56579.1 hypothetical protein CLV56_0788 [Mumia flava]